MPHNALIRPGGVWISLSNVTQAEWEAFDLRQFQSINGDLGGTWAPSSAIIIGGSGMHLTGAVIADDLTLSGLTKVKLASRSITRVQESYLVDAVSFLASPAPVNVPASGGIQYQKLLIPNGVTLTAVIAYINPPNDGVLPGARPTLTVKKINITTGAVTTIGGPTTDPNATVGAYEAHHGFGPTGLAEVVDRTQFSYYAQIAGESGGSDTAVPWYGCTTTYTTTAMDDGY